MMKKKMLITGLSGLLGNNLAYCLKNAYDIVGIYHAHPVGMDGVRAVRADMTAGEGLKRIIKDLGPDIVIHCAAQANVDTCEEYPLEAEKSNVLATRHLVKNLDNRETKFIHISTDLVYDGVKGDFSEENAVHPLNFYGTTKVKAEEEALKRKNSLVLRTNFFGWNVLEGKFSLAEWAIHELSQGNEIKGLTDCHFSSIYTFELAKILRMAIQKDLSGVYNCASSTSMSKYAFLCQIAEKTGLDKSLIKPISVDDFDFRAKRSKNLNLNVTKLATALSLKVPSIEYSIDGFVKDFKRGVPKIIQSYRPQKDFYPLSLDFIPYGRQSIDEDDISAVVEVLKSGAITQGPNVNAFETALCEATDSSYAVAVNSGTAALHMACMAAGIGEGDEVITSPNTFVASANCIVYCGGKPVFADIDPRTYNISPQEIEKKIKGRTKAIIPVHFSGQSCDMENIQNIVKRSEKKYGHKIYIIEDASHALGSRYKTAKVGSCAYSDMATMSFHPVKHITTGEGGAVLTKDKKLYKTLRQLRSHGITSDDSQLTQEKPGPWYYEQQLLGYNYRLTDIQSALGWSQLKKLPYFIQRRQYIAQKYQKLFKNTPHIQLPLGNEEQTSNLHLFVLLIDFEAIGISRRVFMEKLRGQGIITQVHYIPVVMQPFYRSRFATSIDDYPNVKKYYSRCLSIPLFPAMTEEDIKKVFNVINNLITKGNI